MWKTKGKRWLWAGCKALLFTGGIFLLRGGWQRPLLGFADAFSVGGFLLLISGCLHFFRSDTFDGFAYAALSAVWGFFPSRMQPYSHFKRSRAERRERQVGDSQECETGQKTKEKTKVFGREDRWIGGAFLVVGLVLCSFFL